VSGYDIIYLWYETEYCFPLVIKQEVSPKLEDILDTCWKVLPTRGVVSHAIITDTFLLDLHEYTSVLIQSIPLANLVRFVKYSLVLACLCLGAQFCELSLH